jgi:hypothetical protein
LLDGDVQTMFRTVYTLVQVGTDSTQHQRLLPWYLFDGDVQMMSITIYTLIQVGKDPILYKKYSVDDCLMKMSK